MELVARTSELARVFGIDFFSVPCYIPLATSLLHPLSTLPKHTRLIHPLITLPDALSPRAAPPHPVPHPLTVCHTRSQVLNRGSQYRVESMLSRLGRTQDVTMPSPDKERVRQQPALEALPCILEPESRFYTSPVAVLDFRSLYPSVRVVRSTRRHHSACSTPPTMLALPAGTRTHRLDDNLC